MFCQYSDGSHEFDAFSRLLQDEPSAEQPAHAENMNNHANAYNMYKRSTMELEQNGYVPPEEQPHAENSMDDHANAHNMHKRSSVAELEQNGHVVPPTEQGPHAENNRDNHATAYNMYKKRSSESESAPSLTASAQARTSTSTIEEKNAANNPASSSREGSSTATVTQSLLHHRLHLLHRLHMLHRLVMLHKLVQNETVLFESQGRIAAEVAEQAILGG